MHRALLVREILVDIFNHCSPESRFEIHRKADLAALARTCQTFKEPALDVLWEKLFDLSPLPRCLPEVCKIDGMSYSFSRPLSDAEWNTLRGYTRRVRSIFSGVHNRRVVLFLESIADPLFPNLRSLYWSDFGTLPVVHTAVPSLTKLELSFKFIHGVPLQTESLDIFGEHCQNIRNFVALFPRDESLHPAISRQLCRWKHLQRAECRLANIGMDVILRLPSLVTLQWLSFTLSADSGNHVIRPGSAFIFFSLANLEISSTSLKSITTFFSCIQLPKIKDLRVSVSGHTPKREVREFWTTLQKACPANTLARLSFSGSRDAFEDLDPGAQTHLTLIDLLPYKDFGNLCRMSIDGPWSVRLTDADLLDLASTSPHLEELSINNFWGWKMDGPGGITLSGLVQLLRQCPSLSSASLVIDTRTFIQIPHGLDVSFPPRKTFSLDYLDSHFPREFHPGFRSVVATLRLNVWSSHVDSDDGFISFEESDNAGDDA